jgi:hypothetical protein
MSAHGLTDSEFMIVLHQGELAGLEGINLLMCPYLDDHKMMSIWILGYLNLLSHPDEQNELRAPVNLEA